MRSICKEIRTKATPEHAWQAWADPQKLAGFFADRAEGDVTPGSTYTWFFDQFKYQLPYQVVEAIPGEKLALAANIPGFPPGLIEITIHKDGGDTVVRLVNSGFTDAVEFDEMFEGMDSGWEMTLATLKHYLENAWGQPRAGLLVMRGADFEYDRLLPHLRAPQEWLQVETGRELAVTRREVLVEWPASGGVIGFKAFMGSSGRVIGLHPNAWGDARTMLNSVDWHAALERLYHQIQPVNADSH
jgi:uncharacterized protein YndB with AHSA1/START domain